jgi:histidinol phosphatase-like enzyme
MILDCKKKWSINEKKSFIIGDSDVDVDLAKKMKFTYFKVKFKDDLKKISSQILKII